MLRRQRWILFVGGAGIVGGIVGSCLDPWENMVAGVKGKDHGVEYHRLHFTAAEGSTVRIVDGEPRVVEGKLWETRAWIRYLSGNLRLFPLIALLVLLWAYRKEVDPAQ